MPCASRSERLVDEWYAILPALVLELAVIEIEDDLAQLVGAVVSCNECRSDRSSRGTGDALRLVPRSSSAAYAPARPTPFTPLPSQTRSTARCSSDTAIYCSPFVREAAGRRQRLSTLPAISGFTPILPASQDNPPGGIWLPVVRSARGVRCASRQARLRQLVDFVSAQPSLRSETEDAGIAARRRDLVWRPYPPRGVRLSMDTESSAPSSVPRPP